MRFLLVLSSLWLVAGLGIAQPTCPFPPPSPVISGPAQVCDPEGEEGALFTLSVAPDPDPAATYDWYPSIGVNGYLNVEAGHGTPAITIRAHSSVTNFGHVVGGTVTATVRVTNSCGWTDSPQKVVRVLHHPDMYAVTVQGEVQLGVEALAVIYLERSRVGGVEPDTTVDWTVEGGTITSGQGTANLRFVPTSTAVTVHARITNVCGEVVKSHTPSFACQPPQIIGQPPDQTITAGNAVTLEVDATGTEPLSFTWFEEVVGGLIVLGTSRSVTVSPSLDSVYFARVSNACGSIDSRRISVIVKPCTLPSIVTEPKDQRVQRLERATLSVTVDGSPSGIQWFTRNDDGAVEMIPGANDFTYVTPAIDQATVFWAEITHACGMVLTRTATVSIPPSRRRAVR